MALMLAELLSLAFFYHQLAHAMEWEMSQLVHKLKKGFSVEHDKLSCSITTMSHRNKHYASTLYFVLSNSCCQLFASFGATVCDLSLGLSDHKSEFWRALRHPVMIILYWDSSTSYTFHYTEGSVP